MKEEYYSIHDIISFKVVSESRNNFTKRVSMEYYNFQTSDIKDPDIIIYLGKFKPRFEHEVIIDNKYYIGKNYFYCRDYCKEMKWEVEIIGIRNKNLTVKIHGNWLASTAITGMIIDPLIATKLNEKGYSLIHGSGISDKNGNAFVFTAQGGGGKTSTALYSIDVGFKFMGDNFLILHNEQVLSYIQPLNIFSFNSRPIIGNNIPIKKRLELYIKMMLDYTIGVKFVTKINPKDVFPESIQDNAKLKATFLLFPQREFTIQEIPKDQAIKHILSNILLDFVYYNKYLLMYSYVFPNSPVSKNLKIWVQNLEKNLSKNTLFYKVNIPQKYSEETFKKILTKIMEVQSDVSNF